MTPLIATAPAAPAPTSPTPPAPSDILVVHGDHDLSRPKPVVANVMVIADPGWWADDLVRFLGDEGFAVHLDPEGSSAFDHRSRTAHAAILDLQLTAQSAAAVCVAWRRRSVAPVLAVHATRDETGVLAAFAAGADHVVVKDVTPRQLVAHLRSLLRRFPPQFVAVGVAVGLQSVELGEDGVSARVLGEEVRLTDEEFRLLAMLLERPGRVVPRAELANAVVYAGSVRAVDFFVRRLREKLEAVDGKRRIVVVRGVGFRFDAEVDGAVLETRQIVVAAEEDPR